MTCVKGFGGLLSVVVCAACVVGITDMALADCNNQIKSWKACPLNLPSCGDFGCSNGTLCPGCKQAIQINTANFGCKSDPNVQNRHCTGAVLLTPVGPSPVFTWCYQYAVCYIPNAFAPCQPDQSNTGNQDALVYEDNPCGG